MKLEPQAELARIKSQLPPDFGRDIDNLGILLTGKDFPPALDMILFIAEKSLLTLCGQHKIRWGEKEPTLGNMIGSLGSTGAIPRNAAIHLETVRHNSSARANYEEAPLDNAHVLIALMALGEFLRWFSFDQESHWSQEPKSQFPVSAISKADCRAMVHQTLNAAAPAQALEILEQAGRLWPNDIEFKKERLKYLLQVGAAHESYQLAETLLPDAGGDSKIVHFLATSQIELLQRGYSGAKGSKSELLASSADLTRRLLKEISSSQQLLSACRCGVDLAVQLLVAEDESGSNGLLDDLPKYRGKVALSDSEQLSDDLLSIEIGVLRNDAAVGEGVRNLLTKLEALSWHDRFEVLRRTRKNLQSLRKLRTASDELLSVLKTPGVVAFTGHMMDKPDPNKPMESGRKQPRFALEQLEDVTKAIAQKLDELDARIAYGSVACGGDIIFLEQMLKRGGEIHLVIPYPEHFFKEDCINGFLEGPGEEWAPRFDALWQQAESRTILSLQHPQNNYMASECNNAVVLGTGLAQARERGTDLTLVALWDGHPGDAIGGTQSMADMARKRGVSIEFLNTLARQKPTEEEFYNRISMPVGALLSNEPPQEIRAILFSDIVQFSRMEESKVNVFLQRYLQPVTALLKSSRNQGDLLFSDTRGDGLFCIFRSICSAGCFALELQRLIRDGKWVSWGMPAAFNIRIGLHAGPVFTVLDEASGEESFWGSNINFAARIEPATPPGQIFCTQTFAALATVENVDRFACEYVGEVLLPKGTGIHPMYSLRELKGD